MSPGTRSWRPVRQACASAMSRVFRSSRSQDLVSSSPKSVPCVHANSLVRGKKPVHVTVYFFEDQSIA